MIKYVKGDVSIRDSFKKNASQRGLGSHRPHGTTTGLIFTTCRNLLNTSITEHTKGNWYLLARKKIDRQTVHGSEC
jgi:hypothetical protein